MVQHLHETAAKHETSVQDQIKVNVCNRVISASIRPFYRQTKLYVFMQKTKGHFPVMFLMIQTTCYNKRTSEQINSHVSGDKTKCFKPTNDLSLSFLTQLGTVVLTNFI